MELEYEYVPALVPVSDWAAAEELAAVFLLLDLLSFFSLTSLTVVELE